ncbi:MAG TPA: hypothetical protein VGP91_11135 [Actinoplanes sp.]|nr:hypothetical protein [Actinoplanes sp.]
MRDQRGDELPTGRAAAASPSVVSPAGDLREAADPQLLGVECRDLGGVRVLPDDGVLKMNAST